MPEQPPHTERPLLLFSWNGRDQPLAHLHADGQPHFDILLVNYASPQTSLESPELLQAGPLKCQLVGRPTECKGELFELLAEYLAVHRRHPAYVGLIDDDVLISVNDINKLLHLGRWHQLHAFSASLSHDSAFSHRWMLHQPHHVLRPLDWIEVMMPLYSGALFEACSPHFKGFVSSWGFDRYLVPTMQALHGLHGTAVIDAVMAKHAREITSGGQRRYRNGLTAEEESRRMRQLCMALVAQQRPELIAQAWYQQIFKRRRVRGPWDDVRFAIGRGLRRWLDQST